MRRFSTILGFSAAVYAAGCGGGSASRGGDCAECDVPNGRSSLEAFLDRAEHRGFAKESGPHPSAGPHFGDVVAYVSPKLEESLAGGNTTHPVGAGAVKELFGRGGGTEPIGYTVYVKVRQGAGAESYYWYERFDGNQFANGVAEGVCVGCHSGGEDEVVLSPYPLE